MKRFTLPGLILVLAAPALAQDAGDDWDLLRDARQKAVVASLTFDSGVGLGARCMDGAYEMLFSGLPPVSTRLRTLAFSHDGGPATETSWAVGSDHTSAFSDFPAPLARRLRAGGRIEVTVPAENGQPAKRFVLDLPRSEHAIDETLTACHRPLSDPHDIKLVSSLPATGVGGGYHWATPPLGVYPARAIRAHVDSGSANVTCQVEADGRLSDCVVETERPAGVGFGQAAIDSARRARLAPPSGDAPPIAVGAMITFRSNFAVAP
ncbi:MAG: TonB family protein [Caulobacteraceae bacterium]|nr:TonB family protein [Caulobacteraceae bacterium]